MVTTIIFLLVLLVLVVFHEFGHFIVAKIFKIRVDEFAIGFPPRIFSRKVGETEYSLNALPLGGYVKIYGEDGGEGVTTDYKRSFIAQNRFKQTLVLFAGVFMNVILAFLLFVIAIVIGLPVPNGYQGDETLLNQKVIILDVLKDSPAEKIGLRSGDVIGEISNSSKVVKLPSLEEVENIIGQSAGGNISLQIVRGGEEIKLNGKAEEGIIEGKYALGISLGKSGILKLPFFRAIKQSAIIVYDLVVNITLGTYNLIKEAILGRADVKDISGPVGIAVMVGGAAHNGFAYLLSFAAMISANLAVLNLLPLPALDGGRILFVLIESVTRRKLNSKFVSVINTAGFAMLMLLLVLVTYHDIVKYF